MSLTESVASHVRNYAESKLAAYQHKLTHLTQMNVEARENCRLEIEMCKIVISCINTAKLEKVLKDVKLFLL